MVQRRYSFLWSLLVGCGLALTAPARADDVENKIKAAFAPLVSRYDVPGLVVGVTQNGVHHFYAVGLASRADHRPVTPDTLFELGSMSKIFNVTLAALAVERGKMRLSDTVAHHLCDDHCRIGHDLTLLDLATHHSGGLPLQVPDTITDVKELTKWLTATRRAKLFEYQHRPAGLHLRPVTGNDLYNSRSDNPLPRFWAQT